MECSCDVPIDIDIDCLPDHPIETMPTANKEHRCQECWKIIKKGEKYLREKMFCAEGVTVHKTCLVCLSIRNMFFRTGFCYRVVLDDLRLHIRETDAGIPEDCIIKLPPDAKAKVLDMIDDYVQRQYDES